MNGISTFSSHSSKRSYCLKQFLKRKIPTLAPTRWFFTSRLINVVYEHRTVIIDYFREISNNLKDWNAIDREAARGFKRFLNKFDTVFLLEVVAPIFSFSDTLFSALQSSQIDIVACSKKIESFSIFLQNERENGFNRAWNTANQIFGNEEDVLNAEFYLKKEKSNYE